MTTKKDAEEAGGPFTQIIPRFLRCTTNQTTVNLHLEFKDERKFHSCIFVSTKPFNFFFLFFNFLFLLPRTASS